MPVIPGTQEAEARESLEPRRRRLRQAELSPLHSSLVNKSETLSKERKKEREKKERKKERPTDPECKSNLQNGRKHLQTIYQIRG